MECQFCKKVFVNKYILKTHQKTTLYCLKLQDECPKYQCLHCNKVVSTKRWLVNHYQSCIEYKIKEAIKEYKSENKRLKSHIQSLKNQLEEQLKRQEEQLKKQEEKYQYQIEQLQNKLENIAIKAVSRPSNTQINIINNLKILTDKHIESSASNLTINHILGGPSGYAEFALNYAFKDRIRCVDYARRKIRFKNGDGHIVTDPEMLILGKKLFSSIVERNNELIGKYIKQLSEKFPMVDFALEIGEYRIKVIKASRGENTAFLVDVIKYICSRSVGNNSEAPKVPSKKSVVGISSSSLIQE